MAETEKETEDPNFKQGIMSPNSKQTFSAMRRNFQPVGKNKIILDENSFEDRFLRCNICRELYNLSDRSPRLLPCHHCFCLACVLHFYWREEDQRQKLAAQEISGILFVVTVTCPTCGESFVSSLEGLQELVADHRVVQLLDFVGATDKHSIEYCPKHLSQPVNFFCEQCVSRICRDCLVIDHKPCSDAKMVLDIKSAFQKYDPALTSGIKEMEDEAKSLIIRKNECETAKANFKRGDEEVVTAIKESFDRFRKALDEREAALIEMAKNTVGATDFDFDKKSKVYDEKEVEVKELQSVVKDATLTDSLEAKFIAYDKLKKYATEPALKKDEYEAKQDKAVSFNCSEECLLTPKIARFGSVESKSTAINTGYERSSSIEKTKDRSDIGSTGNSYVSSVGSYSAGSGSYSGSSGRSSTYGNYLGGSSLYSSGSPYTNRYTSRSTYRY